MASSHSLYADDKSPLAAKASGFPSSVEQRDDSSLLPLELSYCVDHPDSNLPLAAKDFGCPYRARVESGSCTLVEQRADSPLLPLQPRSCVDRLPCSPVEQRADYKESLIPIRRQTPRHKNSPRGSSSLEVKGTTCLRRVAAV